MKTQKYKHQNKMQRNPILHWTCHKTFLSSTNDTATAESILQLPFYRLVIFCFHCNCCFAPPHASPNVTDLWSNTLHRWPSRLFYILDYIIVCYFYTCFFLGSDFSVVTVFQVSNSVLKEFIYLQILRHKQKVMCYTPMIQSEIKAFFSFLFKHFPIQTLSNPSIKFASWIEFVGV